MFKVVSAIYLQQWTGFQV